MGSSGKEKYKTFKTVFDDFTERNIFQLMSQGYIDGLIGPVSVGKEANIFSAKKGEELRIIKIYRLQNCDFNKMYDYIKSDPRYSGLTKKRREVVFAWAHRESRNLLKSREAGVRVPTAYTNLQNVLVMEFIGDDAPSPKLKDAKPSNLQKFFDDLISQMKKLYKAGLVHGDLSGFNILNLHDKAVIIDMSQAAPLDDPNSIDWLKRDIKNICILFKKWGLQTSEEELFKKITNTKI